MNQVISRPVLFNLFYTMMGGQKQLISLRISILYCLPCYLYKNKTGKSMMIQIHLPQTKNGQFFVFEKREKSIVLISFSC